MIIDFSKMDLTVLPNFKGGEKEFAANMFFDGTNRAFRGRLAPGASIGVHTHDDSCEFIFILEGKGTVTEVEPGSDAELLTPVTVGHCLYCPKGHTHSLKNTSEQDNLVFYAVVAKQ